MELIIQCNFTKHFSNPSFRLLLYLIFPQVGKTSTLGIYCVNQTPCVCVQPFMVQYTHQQVQLTTEINCKITVEVGSQLHANFKT